MLDRLKDVFKSFQNNGVKYVVIGGIAAVIYGVPRATFDLDILIEATPENARNLLLALHSAGFGTADLTTPAELLSNEITVFNDKLRIDVQTATPGISFSEAWKNKSPVVYLGQEIIVVSKDDLILSKKASNREIDIEDIRVLRISEEEKSVAFDN
jgi:predicted nucleotidyltransferase